MSTAALRRRIKSVKGTEQITKAMKTVATSKYSKVSAQAQSFAPYMEHIRTIKSYFPSPAQTKAEDGGVCYVLITGNRGMCGQYNYSALKHLESILEEEKRPFTVISCGKWGTENLKRSMYADLTESFDTGDVPDSKTSALLADRLSAMYAAGEVTEVCFVYNKFKNILVQTPTAERLFPENSGDDTVTEDDWIFVPAKEDILKNVKMLFVRAQVHSVLLSAAQGFYGASLTAMRTASDNSAQMLEKLEQELNRSRQGEITTEVLELASGVRRGE